MIKNKSEPVSIITPKLPGGLIFKDSAWYLAPGSAHNLFHINRLEDVRQAMTFPMLPHRKTVNDFILITHGTMIRRKGLNLYEFGAHTFFFLPVHQISLDDWMSEDIKGYYCHFDTTLLTKRSQKQDLENEFPFMKFIGHPLICLDNELLTKINPLLERLEIENKNSRFDSGDLFRIYLLALFTELKRAIPSDKNKLPDRTDNASLRITQLYKNALSQFIYEKQTVSDYADLLNISPNHLNKCVKTIAGQSARDLLDEMILLEAKVLLSQSELSVSEIAYRIGKQDPSNFGRFFKTKTGMTPKEYRQTD